MWLALLKVLYLPVYLTQPSSAFFDTLQSDRLCLRRLQLVSAYLTPSSTREFWTEATCTSPPPQPPGLTVHNWKDHAMYSLTSSLFVCFVLFLMQSKPLCLYIFDHFQHLRSFPPNLKEYSRLQALSIPLFCNNTEMTEMFQFNLAKD